MCDSSRSEDKQDARFGRPRQWLWWSLWLPLVLLGFLLGLWQWDRAGEKRDYLARLDAAPELTAPRDAPPEGTRLTLSGEYMADQTLFLDNRILDGRLGVAVLTPLRGDDGRVWLVNRGFLETGPSRETPIVDSPEGSVTLKGVWQASGDQPPLFGPNREGQRLQGILLEAWEQDFAHPGWMHLEDGEGAFDAWWQPSVMPPSRHLGYAVQWWGLALAALLVMLIGGRKLHKPQDKRKSASQSRETP